MKSQRKERSFMLPAALGFLILFLAHSISAAQTSSGYKIKTIVLDAGHGGHDAGCSGVYSNEKDVTLDIVLKLGEMIKQNYPGIKVIYTRTTDVFIELYERADIANRNKADLFISVHCNANKSHSPYGTETWLMGLHKSEGNLEVSMRENSVIKLEENYQENYGGFDPNSPEGYIILTLNQNAHRSQSIDLATKVEENFSKDGRGSRGVKQAGFLVLWRTTMPAILIETGFLTNREEEKYLASEKGQREVAQNILDAISAYKHEVEGGDLFKINPEQKAIVDTQAQANSESAQVQKQSKDASLINSVIYRVQIYASPKLSDKSDPKLSGVEEDLVIEMNENGMYRYMVGNCFTLNDVNKHLQLYRSKGFKDAFVVAYHNGKRIPLTNVP